MKSVGFIKQAVILLLVSIVGCGLFTYIGHIKILGNYGFIGVCIVFALGLVLHLLAAAKDEDHVKKVFAFSKTGRNMTYDYARCLALVLVVIVHVSSLGIEDAGAAASEGLSSVFRYLSWSTLSCNMLYMMLSGALLLQFKEEKLLTFYGNRIIKVLVPILLYYLWYCLPYFAQGQMTVGTFLYSFFSSGALNVVPFFWLFYQILALYIVTPFLRYFLHNVPYKIVSAYVCLSIVFIFLNLYFPQSLGIKMPLIGWPTVAITGYWITKEETEKYHKLILAVGVASAIATYFVIKYDPNYSATLASLSPYTLLIGMGLFSGLLIIKKHLKELYIISLFSKYNFGMILIHWFFLNSYTRNSFGISIYGYKGLGFFLSLIITILGTFVMAFFLDNYLLFIINVLINKIKSLKSIFTK